MTQQPLTIGIEEEFQIVGADGDLKAHIAALLAAAQPILGEDVKAEMLQSVVEVGTKIWWDVRPHWLYPTIEFRICDACTKVDEVICIAALIQGICAKLLALREGNLGFRKYLPSLINENKWRAMRYGVDGSLIDFGKLAEVPMRRLALELLEFVDDVVDELDSRKEVEYVHTILREGTSADRQLRLYQQAGSLEAVVDHLAGETMAGVRSRA